MKVQSIRIYGDPILRRKADPVERFDDELRAIVDDMFGVMLKADGIGLAAPQVGISRRFLIIGMPKDNDEIERLFFANPRIEETAGSAPYDEGCLSVPGIRAEIIRPEWIRVKYQDLDGSERVLEDGELLARVLQHEIDHLNGILFVDRLSPAKKALLKKTLQKMAQTGKQPDDIPEAFAEKRAG